MATKTKSKTAIETTLSALNGPITITKIKGKWAVNDTQFVSTKRSLYAALHELHGIQLLMACMPPSERPRSEGLMEMQIMSRAKAERLGVKVRKLSDL